MRLHQSEGFVDAKKRAKLGIPRGERIDFNKKARFRWVCVDPNCGSRQDVYWHHDPRRNTWAPRAGQHSRVALRTALMLRRNQAESAMAAMKHRGIGGRGSEVPRWVSTDNQFLWLTRMTDLASALRRVVHEDGSYWRVYDEAVGRRLVKIDVRHGQGRAGLPS